MFRSLAQLSILALLTLSVPAIAQQATADDPPAAGNALDLGQSADGSPQLGERYSKEKFHAWDLACIKTAAETDPCSLLQVLEDEDGNAVAEVSLFRIEGDGPAVAAATVIVPLETLLPAQLTIAVDGATGKRYNYSFCNPIGCVAQIGLTAEDIAAFKAGKEAIVSLRPAPAPDQIVSLSMSLDGFTAGYEVVDVVAN